MNIIQYAFSQGWSSAIYNGSIAVAFAGHMVFQIWYRKKYDISLLNAFLIALTVCPFTFYWMKVLTWLENDMSNWGAMNVVRAYVYIPPFCILVSKLLKVKLPRLLDYITPSIALHQSIAHLGCPFAGCCRGYPSSWGIWNPLTLDTRFPNQFLESIVAFAIFLFLYRYAKKKDFTLTGKSFPLFLVLFGSTRFLLEFLRDNEKFFRGISSLALHAAFMVVVGGLWLYCIYLKEDAARHKKPSSSRSRQSRK